MKVTWNNFLKYMVSKGKFWTVSYGILKLFATMKSTMHSVLHFLNIFCLYLFFSQTKKKERVIILCRVFISAGSVSSLLHKDSKYLNNLGYKCNALVRRE